MENKSLFLTDYIKQEPEEEFIINLPPFQSNKRLLGGKKKKTDEDVEKLAERRRRRRRVKQNVRPTTNSNKIFVCDICGETKTEKRRMREHLHVHIKSFKCECGKLFGCEKALKSHKRIHEEFREMFECSFCPAIYSNIGTLKYHVKHYHLSTENQFKCEQCEYVGKTRHLLIRHLRSHLRAFKCTQCEKDFCRKEGLKNHMKFHERPETFVCLCTRVFKKLNAYSNHMRMAHKPGQPIEVYDVNLSCKICNKKFTEKGNLIRHIKMHQGDKPMTKCPICSKVFAADSLKRHLDRHQIKEKGRSFKCLKCPKKYFTSKDLKYHLNFHEKKLSCDLCGDRFALKSAIRYHILVHINPDIFKCNICQRRCLTKSHLNHHKKKMHA